LGALWCQCHAPLISRRDAFDKISRALRIPWTGSGPGAALEALAAQHDSSPLISFPSKILPGQLAFSYSGMRTAVERHIAQEEADGRLDETERVRIAASFQAAAIATLEDKILLALRKADAPVGSLVVSGGVASNTYLRTRCVALWTACGISSSPVCDMHWTRQGIQMCD
jgi:N6-L-threonylcarbamoyladenine synthase